MDERLHAIDGLRAVAVLAVVIHHMDSAHPFVFGSRGVDLFFVISGFCLSLPVLRRVNGGKAHGFDVRRFAIARFWRIAPPYWAAIAAFGILALTTFGTPSVTVTPRPTELIEDASIFFTSLGSSYNPSFWTLGIEARWYIFFPAILALYIRSKVVFAILAVVLYCWYATPFSIPDSGTLPCFMLGIVAADVTLRGHARHVLWLPAAALFLGFACFTDRSLDHGSPIWHVTAFLLLLAGVGVGRRILPWRPLVFLGVASYSIYLVHGPAMTWLENRGVPMLIAGVLSIGLGILFWTLVEVPTLRLRDRLRYSGRPLAPPKPVMNPL